MRLNPLTEDNDLVLEGLLSLDHSKWGLRCPVDVRDSLVDPGGGARESMR